MKIFESDSSNHDLVQIATGDPTAQKHRRSTLEDITNIADLNVSRWTVSPRLDEAGINSYVACQKPCLSDKQIADRFAWAKKYENWTVGDWKHVIWSNECDVVIGLNPEHPHVWRKKNQELLSD